MKKPVAVLLAVFLVLLSSSCLADWEKIDEFVGIAEFFDRIGSPVNLFDGTCEMYESGFIAYLIGMNIYGQTGYFRVTMNEDPYVGFLSGDAEDVFMVFLPIPKEKEKEAQKYKPAMYCIRSRELYYENGAIAFRADIATGFKEHLFLYQTVDTYSRAHSLDMLDQFIMENVGEDFLEFCEAFLVGYRPVDWTELYADVFGK